MSDTVVEMEESPPGVNIPDNDPSGIERVLAGLLLMAYKSLDFVWFSAILGIDQPNNSAAWFVAAVDIDRSEFVVAQPQ